MSRWIMRALIGVLAISLGTDRAEARGRFRSPWANRYQQNVPATVCPTPVRTTPTQPGAQPAGRYIYPAYQNGPVLSPEQRMVPPFFGS